MSKKIARATALTTTNVWTNHKICYDGSKKPIDDSRSGHRDGLWWWSLITLGEYPALWLTDCLPRVWTTTAHWSMVTTWRGICFYCQAAACSSIPDQGRQLHCTQLNVSERVDTHWWTSLRKSFGNVWQCFGQVESGLWGPGENLSSKE